MQQHPGLWEEHFIAKHIFKQNATKKRKRIKKKKKKGKKSYNITVTQKFSRLSIKQQGYGRSPHTEMHMFPKTVQ